MINWIQPTCKSPPPDGLLLKSQPTGSEAAQSPSFGEILKAKEKKDQKELENSAFPTAAALAVVAPAPPAETPSASSEAGASSKIAEVSPQAAIQSSINTVQPQSEDTGSTAQMGKTQPSSSTATTASITAQAAPASQTAPQTFAAVQQKQDAASIKPAETQADTTAAVLPASTPVPQAQAAAIAEATTANIKPVETQAETQAAVLPASTPVPQAQAAATAEATTASIKPVETQTDTTAAALPASTPVPQMQAPAATEAMTASIKPVETQVDTPAAELPASTVMPQAQAATTADSGVTTASIKPVGTQVDTPATGPTVSTAAHQKQAAAATEATTASIKPVETQAETTAAGLPASTPVPPAQAAATADSGVTTASIKPVEIQANTTAAVLPVSTAVPQTQDPTASGATTASIMAVEAQVSATALTAKAASSDVTDPSLETGKDQAVASTDTKKKVDNLQAISGIISEAVEAAATPVLPISSTTASAAITSGASAKTQTDLAGLKTSPINEKVPPSEAQPDASLLATQTASASPLKGAAEMNVVEKLAAPQTGPQAGEVVQQIMRQMSATLQSGPSSMHLQLNPKELGAIDVQMVKSAQGISVTFFAEHASTGRLLETQMNQLRQSLTDSGIQLSNLNIGQHGQPAQQQGGSFKQASQFAQYANRNAAQSETKAAIDKKLQTERNAGLLQGVDYRI